ncbi:MAG: hypothetical protein OXS29_14690 [bacterium]|nr:hypothetical protein [bacterium]MDE0290366.1 hypothetical protein [bacterium]MDE0438542.1 hypothetical protein [bacterium]
MADADYQEIIALSEDPDLSVDGDRGRPFTPQEDAWLAELADAIFLGRPIEKQVADIRDMPIEVSIRRLLQLGAPRQVEILSRLPDDLARLLRPQLPVGVS